MRGNLLFRLAAVAFALVAPVFAGCPDYSHQRAVPDYKNMVDGGEEVAPEDREKGE